MVNRRPRSPFVLTFSRRRRRRRGYTRTNNTSERKEAYLAYMSSPAWRAFRAAWWTEYDRRNATRTCYCCTKPQTVLPRSLELHHRTYERLGAEHYDDLVAVCSTCHSWITRTWRARGKTGLTMNLWELTDERRRRMRTYLAKREGRAGEGSGAGGT